MKTHTLHRWDVEPSEARKIQDSLAFQVVKRDTFTSISKVCGVDVSFKGGTASAACVVMSFPDLEVLAHSTHSTPVRFPYIPGLLSFREIPPLLHALETLHVDPDLIIADGQGIAHTRALGLASHLGLLLDTPTIGCAKSRLVGSYEEPGEERFDWEYLYNGDDVIGAVLRTRRGVKPVFVSIGHRIALHSAMYYVSRCCMKYRITEPVRVAHRLAGGGNV
jgi:deoxyribonuclease V